jgi:uncharacterized protein (TIGR00730 family)
MKRVVVFCGSAPGIRPIYADAARELGTAIAKRGMGLVYGGASIGLMGIVADAALAAGGEVIGVIPNRMVDREIAHRGLTSLEVVDTMHQRKARMVELADAGAISLPGGLGTLDESFELLTWQQLGLVDVPLVFLDIDGYWAPLAAFLDHAAREGFVRPAHRANAELARTVDAALDALAKRPSSNVSKWA